MKPSSYEAKFGKYLKFTKKGRTEAQALCPFHLDTHPSFSVNLDTGLWNCFTCGSSGNWQQFLERVDPDAMVTDTKLIVSNDEVEKCHKVLLKTKGAMSLLTKQRGLSCKIIDKYMLGFDNTGNDPRIWIPVTNSSGKYINIRKYRPGVTHRKVIGYKTGYNTVSIFPAEPSPNDDVYVMEGEMDMLLARSIGLDAYTQTAGAMTWSVAFNKYFKDKNVFIAYDNDDEGRKGAEKVAAALAPVAKAIHIVNLPVDNSKEDFTDYIVKYGKTAKDFLELCRSAEAQKVKVQLEVERSNETHEVDLFQASSSEYHTKLVKLHVLVIGKDMSPYILPKDVVLTCDGGRKACRHCPVAAAGGSLTITYEPDDPEILELMDVNKRKQELLFMKRIGLVYGQCAQYKVEVKNTFNIEQLSVINDVECVIEKSDYTVASVYYSGHGIKANTTYEMIGRVYPDPRTQHAAILVHEMKPAKSNVEAFNIDNGVAEGLKIFKIREG